MENQIIKKTNDRKVEIIETIEKRMVYDIKSLQEEEKRLRERLAWIEKILKAIENKK